MLSLLPPKTTQDLVPLERHRPDVGKTCTQVVLHFAFDYPLQEGLDGLYRSTYVDAATNVTHTIASTQFEAIAARKAFPCFDEPQWKAAFQAELIAPPPPIVALSNMPLAAPPADLANGMTHYKYQVRGRIDGSCGCMPRTCFRVGGCSLAASDARRTVSPE